MSKKINLKNKVFGRLLVKSYEGNRKWKCVCSCGNARTVYSTNLSGGHTKSCGCLRDEKRKGRKPERQTHGLSRTRVWHIWANMKYRCGNKKSPLYRKYGALGISVSEEWKKFENFIKDMGHPPTEEHSIDRINGSLGYNKSNCRWATYSEQSSNTKQNVNLTFNGKTQNVAAWSRELKIHDATLRSRLRRGLPIQKVLSVK